MEENVAVVREFLGLFFGGDLPAALAKLADDVVSHEPESLPYAGDHRGHDGFAKLTEQFAEVWQVDAATASLDLLPAGSDRVLSLMEVDVVSVATAKPIRLKLAEVYTVRDSKITEVWVYSWDTAAMLRALR